MSKPAKTKFHCPKCRRTIFNRRVQQCEFCGAKLPKALLLTKAEVDAIDTQRCEADKKRREFQEQQHWPHSGAGDDVFFPPVS